MRLKVGCLIAAVSLVCAPVLPGLSLTDVDANGGGLLIGTWPPSGYVEPNPAVSYVLGASLPLWLTPVFFLEPDIELWGTFYEWTGDGGVAVPTLYESAASFYTVGILVSAQAGAAFPVSPAVSLGGALGLDLLFRFPVDPFNSVSASSQQPALDWFFADGRFFYPETRLFLRWTMSPSIVFILNLRAFYPLFHAWDGAGQPFLDQAMGAVDVGVGFRLGTKKSAVPSS